MIVLASVPSPKLAVAAARDLGRANKTLIDEAKVAAMVFTLGQIIIDGIVAIGEGGKGPGI